MIYRLKYAKSESNFDADFEHPTCKGKSFTYRNGVSIFIRCILKLLPLQGALLIAFIPRAMPWAKSFCPFRACWVISIVQVGVLGNINRTGGRAG